MQEMLPFHPDNPAVRVLLVQMITGRKFEDIPESLRERVADRCSETCKNYISEFLLIHYGRDSASGFAFLLQNPYYQMLDEPMLISQIKQAYKSFIDLVENSPHTH